MAQSTNSSNPVRRHQATPKTHTARKMLAFPASRKWTWKSSDRKRRVQKAQEKFNKKNSKGTFLAKA